MMKYVRGKRRNVSKVKCTVKCGTTCSKWVEDDQYDGNKPNANENEKYMC